MAQDSLPFHNPACRLATFDVDGTLLPFGTWELRFDILSEVQRLMQKGIVFCVASGRQYNSCRHLFDRLPEAEDIYYLCENGGVIVHRGEVIYDHGLDREDAIQMAEQIQAIPSGAALISGPDTAYILTGQPKLEHHCRERLRARVKTVERFSDVDDQIIKVALYAEKDVLPHYQRLAEQWGDRYHVLISGTYWIDISNADKGLALRHLTEMLRLTPEMVLAVGDNFNDIGMLRYAGRSYAMAGAHPDVQQAATDVCDDILKLLASISRA